MLPLLRVLPIGSLLVTALIFVLAATPPRRAPLPHDLAPARGPLIDAAEHPEWRQFYLQAAFKRAGELDQLRDLPNAPTRMPPIAALPEPQKQKAPPAPPSDAVAAVAPPAPDKADEPAPAPQKDMPPVPAAAAAPPALAGNERAPLSAAPPQQVAGLPNGRESADADDVTGALDSPVVAATMPMEIGETSSTELSVVLPQRAPRLPVPRPKAGARAKVSPAHARPSKPKRQAPAAKQQVPPAAESNSYQSTFGEH